MQYLVIGVRCLLGVVFLVSSISKVAGRNAFPGFVTSLRELWPLRVGPARLVAGCVIGAEVAIWVLLAVPGQAATATGCALAAGLLAVFAVGIATAMQRDVRAPCRCFGTSTSLLGPWHIVRNALLAAAAAGAAAVSGAGPVGPLRPDGVVVAVAGGLLLGGLITVADDLVSLFRPLDNPNDKNETETHHGADSDRGRGSGRTALRA